jgi:hypothetical protein
MTPEAARVVAGIMMTADGDCSWCAAALLRQLVEAFPETREAVNTEWSKDHDPYSWETMK